MESGDSRDQGQSGVEIVRCALRDLDPPVAEAASCHEPVALAELVLDHAGRLGPGGNVLQYLSILLLDRVDDMALRQCDRDFLLVDSEAVAEQALFEVLTFIHSGERHRPILSWIRGLIRDITVKWKLHDNFLAFRVDPEQPKTRHLVEAARLINGLPLDARQVVFEVWVNNQPVRRVARSLGMPLERAEWLVEHVLSQAGLRLLDPEERDSDDQEGTLEPEGRDG